MHSFNLIMVKSGHEYTYLCSVLRDQEKMSDPACDGLDRWDAVQRSLTGPRITTRMELDGVIC